MTRKSRTSMIGRKAAVILCSVAILCSGLVLADRATAVSLVGDVANPDLATCAQEGFIDFEGIPNGTDLTVGAIGGVQFTTTGGFTWNVGDFSAGGYNGKYPNGSYTSQGSNWAWLGPDQGLGRIDFPSGKASYISLLVSSATPVTLEAYDRGGVLLEKAGPSQVNTGTGHMAQLTIDRSHAEIAYVMVHDSGNFFLLDALCTDARGVGSDGWVEVGSRGTGDLGVTCGEATFDWYENTAQPTFVRNGEDACVLLLSNGVVRELLRIAIANQSSLTEVFGELIAHELKQKGIGAAQQTLARYALSSLLRQLVPRAATFISSANLFYTVAKLSSYNYMGLHALFVLSQIEAKGACIQIDFDVDDGKLLLDWNLVYNPSYFSDIDGTHAHEWDRIEKRFQFDDLKQRNLGMSCTGDGLVKVGTTPGGVLRHAEQVVLSARQ